MKKCFHRELWKVSYEKSPPWLNDGSGDDLGDLVAGVVDPRRRPGASSGQTDEFRRLSRGDPGVPRVRAGKSKDLQSAADTGWRSRLPGILAGPTDARVLRRGRRRIRAGGAQQSAAVARGARHDRGPAGQKDSLSAVGG